MLDKDLEEGEVVLLHDQKGRQYRVKLRAGATFSIHSGTLPHEDLIGKPEGSLVRTNMGGLLLALRPTFAELVIGRRRLAQPIYPKDLGAILVHADIHPGARVLEAGTGTGALSMALSRAVGHEGSIVSYELREDLQIAARSAIEDALGGIPTNLELRLGDIYQEVPEGRFDRVMLDVPEPWQAIPQVAPALRPGGIIFSLSPNVSQVQRFSDGLRDAGGFGLIHSLELLERGWTVRGRSMRPSHRMVAHTAFLTFARRLAGTQTFETEGEGFR